MNIPPPLNGDDASTPQSPESPVDPVGPNDPAARMDAISRRSFLWACVAVESAYVGLRWMDHQPDSNGVAAPFRKGQDLNRAVWSRLYSPDRLVPTYGPSDVTEERVNGDDGLSDDFDPSDWTLSVEGVHGKKAPVSLSIDDIRKMPASTMTTEFFCIEGWSQIQTWKGVLMREFMSKYPPQTMSGGEPDLDHGREDLLPYVYMETPDQGYYVGLDMPSVLHAQTMLCYEINGQPLSLERGAPLRLVIPVKYGVKNIKRISLIRYTRTLPADFWAEQGYDWYCGL
jgi:DMSO/TMAO reductase YedYZ molybdopterin-dependent catalytic subunit